MSGELRKCGILPLLYLFLMGVFPGCGKEDLKNEANNQLIPVSLSASVSRIQTRVKSLSFEKDDQIGLFILEQPKVLAEVRHADNQRFVYDGSDWKADHEVYYPQGEGKSTFWAYYPYLSEGIPAGKSVMRCEVKADQSADGNYSVSDFLVATTNDVLPGTDAVSLNFKHKLTGIEIVLDPGNAFGSAQELLQANPTVTLKDVCMTTEYDFSTGSFTKQSNKSDVVPAGTFVVQDNLLIGKKCVIVPQALSMGHVLIELSAGNKKYSFTLGEEYQFRSGTRETYTLTLTAFIPENIPTRITALVSDWENDSSQSGNLNEKGDTVYSASDCYSVSIPDFSTSSVYKIMDGKMQIAEICREYLTTKNIDNQAIVLYPKKGNTIDYTKGFVLQVLEKNAGKPLTGAVHGGTVSWDNNSPIYVRGDMQPLNTIYMDVKGNVSDVPVGKTIETTTLDPDLLVTPADNKNYPVVKIGTQHWMGQSLKSVYFMDHTPIALKEDVSQWKTATTACCHYQGTDEILYKYKSISEKIEPEGWKVPGKSDWDRLALYLNWNPVLLEDASWGMSDSKLNLTGFSATKTGIRLSDGSFYPDSPGYWHSEGGYACFVNGMIKVYSDETSSGCSLRLLKK